ncbi:hypothetical protein C8R48DRAFT_690520, partial [Suillus tomentosus]
MPTMEKLPGPRSTWVNLFIVEDLEHDSAFVVFRSHHTVAVHLWLSLFAYRSAGLLMISTVSYHVEEACNILHGLIPNSSIEMDLKMTQSPTHAKKPTRSFRERVKCHSKHASKGDWCSEGGVCVRPRDNQLQM